MAATEILRVRMDKTLARRLLAWAKKNKTNQSEVIRIAVRRLLEERARERRAMAAVRRIHELSAAGVFDPPKRFVKAGGFR